MEQLCARKEKPWIVPGVDKQFPNGRIITKKAISVLPRLSDCIIAKMFSRLLLFKLRVWLHKIKHNASNVRPQRNGLLTTVMWSCCVWLTAPHGPVRHWWDWLRGRLFLPLAFGEDGKGRDSLERDGHWDMAQSCSVVGRSSGSHSLAFTSWSLKLTHSTCRVVFPWPQVTEHWKHRRTVDKQISHE